MLVRALARERDTSSCGHCSEKGATVSKAAPPIIPSIPSFFMIGLRPPKAHSKAQRHQCSKIKSGQGVAKVGPRRGRKIWSPSGVEVLAPAGNFCPPRRSKKRALPLYQQMRPLREQRRRRFWSAIAFAPSCKTLAFAAGSDCGDGQTTAPG